jgi:hypothetical protein
MQTKFPKLAFIFSILFFIATCFGYYFLATKINNNEDEFNAKTISWQMEASRRDGIRALNDSIKAIAEERANLDTHFAASSNVVPFFDSIEALGPKVGVDAQVTSVELPVKDPGLIVGVSATGSFEGVYKFINLLENFPYELDFVSMDIHTKDTGGVTPKAGTKSQWVATFKVRLLTFIQ